MFRALVFLASIAAVTNGFVCMTLCRKPLWTCINKGIPGHEIEELQKCVIKDIQAGMWDDQTECIECFEEELKKNTNFPTLAPVEEVEVDCGSNTRQKKCEKIPECIWTKENSEKGECMLISDSQFTPTPTKATYIDDMQPCLTYCRDQAMDCAFTHGVDTTCVACMRECVHDVSFDTTPGNNLYKPECGQCIADVFEVLGDPQNPPTAGFALFSDYQKWMRNKGIDKSCIGSGGKWKIGRNKNRCLPAKKPNQLRCKKIGDRATCDSIGCNFNTKKNRCAGNHKWKKAKQGKKNKGGR